MVMDGKCQIKDRIRLGWMIFFLTLKIDVSCHVCKYLVDLMPDLINDK